MGSAVRKTHNWQDDKNFLNQILYTLNFIAVGYDMMLNTTQRVSAKTLLTTVSHKRHHILHSPLWASNGAPPVRPLEKSYRTQHQRCVTPHHHYSDVIMDAMPSGITAVPSVYSTADQGIRQSYASLAPVRGIHRWPVNSRTKGQ